MKDVLGRDIVPGDRVGCAFSYSQASVGTIRLGEVVEIEKHHPYPRNPDYETYRVKCKWDKDGKVSPWMHYGADHRWIKI
jgi:hypothetical protein